MRLFFWLLPIFFCTSILGQAHIDSIQQFHKIQLSKLILLKNASDIIPIKGLANQKISYLATSQSHYIFYETLQKYTNIQFFQFPANLDDTQLDNFYAEIASKTDLLILSYDDTSDTHTLKESIQKLPEKLSVILVFFGKSLLGLEEMDTKASHAILYCKDKNIYIQSLAAQFIFGAIKQNNQVALNKSISRLSYGAPELVEMDGSYLKKTIQSIIQEGLDSMAFPGAQVLVARRGKVIYEESFGYHTYAKNYPVQLTDLYDLASITKVTTAIPALMHLYDRAIFDLDANLATYFPDFENSNKAALQFRPILAHQARLQPYIVFWQKAKRKNGKYKWRTFKSKFSKNYPIKIGNQLYLHRKYKRKMISQIKATPLKEQTAYVYSGLSFLLYPDLIKNKLGVPFDQFLYKKIYRPIGAYRLLFNPINQVSKSEIIPTEEDDFLRMQLVHGTVHDEAAAMLNGVSSNAGLFGNANDLAKLLQLFLNDGKYGGEQFFEQSTIQAFTRCQYCELGNRRGLGFDKPLIEYDAAKSYIAQSASPDSYGHSGFTGTFFWVDPKEELIVIFLSNRVHPTRKNRKLYTMKIRERVHQAAYDAILN